MSPTSLHVHHATTSPRPSPSRPSARRQREPDKGVIESCTILTTVANAVLAPVHDRMPVILPPTEYARWLDPALRDTDSLAPLLVPFPPEGMLAMPVNPRVNSPAVDDEDCIAPLP